ncbi:LuxR C-terminal-related transcriptional regulator [Paenibacillus terrae]|uniref:LuxR C-terminal-related transcriptional regulator n=1 Tax=Paenibacillus terrae TaxID=159743 RepID=UPI0005CBE2B6|nr:helix-turn-helix transcriptional regulator [Paenibacillus terrae]
MTKGNDHKNKFLLTHREREVFELLVQDKTTRDIAGQLFISEKTVRNHISNMICFEARKTTCTSFLLIIA